jgi:hypothetical protein
MSVEVNTIPYPKRTIIITAFLTALFSVAFSGAILWYQADKSEEPIVGSVVSVEMSQIVIKGARGNLTTIVITPETKIRDISPLSTLATGTPVMAIGTFSDKDTFIAEGIRKFDKKR